jgi:putative membrane protein
MRKILFRWLGPSLVPALFLGTAWAQTAPDTGGYGPRMMWWDGGSTMMFFGPLFMIVTLAALVAAIVFLVRWQGGGLLPPAKTALDILKERFARGEIDKTEFDERRRVLAE